MQASNPQSPNASAAIYCRISSDKTGRAAGVERQEGDCRAMASRLGLTVAHVLVDNDISAYSGKPRPQYERLLELVKEGAIGTVLAYHQDRLQRSPTELEAYLDAVESNGVGTHTVLSGFIDLSTPSGRFQARIVGAAARYEVEHMVERQRDAKLDAASQGRFLGGQRPFGFERRRTAIRESEAELLREMADRVIAGGSFWSVAVDLNRRGILTQHGKDWNALKVRNVLIRPINAGIVLHKGVEYPSESPAIFTREEWAELHAAIEINRRASKYPGRARKHLLKGFLYCGLCEEKLFHKSKQQRDGSYRTTAACGKTDNQTGKQHGCGKVSRMVEPIIELVTDCIMYRLDSPELATALHKSKSSADALKTLTAQQRALTDSITELTDDYYVHHLLTRDEFQRAKAQTDAKLGELSRAIEGELSSTSAASIDLSGDIQERWEHADLEWKRRLLTLLISGIYVDPMPKTEGYRYPKFKDKYRFDPELIRIEWRH
ncbi:recombinase family protein [Rhodococcus sp. NPDC004095]